MRDDAVKVTAMELTKLSPGRIVQSAYKSTGKDKNILWKEIQTLFHSEKYSAAKECTILLMEIAKAERMEGLYKRALLILARIFVVLGDPRATDIYKRVITEVYSDLFVYTTPYSYTIEVFKQSKGLSSSEYSFIFSEYLKNVKISKKERQEYLFYSLIALHIQNKDPWDPEGEKIDLSLLPVHIREKYVEYTTDVIYDRNYKHQIDKLDRTDRKTQSVNRRNSAYCNNFRFIYGQN